MFILAERNDAIGTLIFNQPTKRNALSAALVEELITALDSFQKEGIRVVVLRAARDARVWSSGHDITELPQGQDPLPYSDSFEKALRAIKTFATPIIAMVHGSVWGVATELVLSCDIAIGDETSSFAVTPPTSAWPTTPLDYYASCVAFLSIASKRCSSLQNR